MNSETMAGGEVEWRVKAFVHDVELEDVLNGLYPEYEVEEMFRNTAGKDGQETTTIVARRAT